MNLTIRPMQVSKVFPNFDRQVIMPAMQWWDDYIETGVSPEFDEERDKDILIQLRQITEQERQEAEQREEDEHIDRLTREHGYDEDAVRPEDWVDDLRLMDLHGTPDW